MSRRLADDAVADEARQAALPGTNPVGALCSQDGPYTSPERDRAQRVAREAIDLHNRSSNEAAQNVERLASFVLSAHAFVPARHVPWYDSALHDVGDFLKTGWGDLEGYAPQVGKAGRDALVLAGFFALGGISAGGFGVGVAADATVFGIPVGVVIDTASVAGLAAATAGVTDWGYRLSEDLLFHESRSSDSPGSGASSGDTPEREPVSSGGASSGAEGGPSPRGLGTKDLSGATRANYGRFVKSLPANAEEPTITQLPSGDLEFESDVPAANIPGSYAKYTKVVDPQGRTVTYYKTTYAPDGSVVHVKVKYP